MKRFVLLCVLLLGWANAQAQEIAVNGRFGIRLDLFIPGIHLGIEAGTAEWKLGTRASINSLAILNTYALDVYIRYALNDGTAFYFGAGRRWTNSITSYPATDWHGLLGVQFPNQLFIEIQPGIANGKSCGPFEPPQAQARTAACGSSKPYETFSFLAAIGWSWRF